MKYGFIGCGNMGGAIVRAVSRSTTEIMITDRSGKGQRLAQELGITYSTATHVARECDRIFLAVKPQMMNDAISPIRDILQERRPLLITMAAGLTMDTIKQMVGVELPVIRIMPNTPAAVGAGMTVYCHNDLVDPAVLEDFIRDMTSSGKMDALSEQLIDAASAISGSGPAYMYMFMDALADGAVSIGISRQKALEYAAATMAGAAQLMLETGQHPGALKDAVCSPAGSTIAGVRVLEERGFRGAVIDCVTAAYQRNIELGKK